MSVTITEIATMNSPSQTLPLTSEVMVFNGLVLLGRRPGNPVAVFGTDTVTPGKVVVDL
jgi:hypothetical protein